MNIKRTVLATSIATLLAGTAQADLVISEYVEGSSNNKALELLNTSDTPVDLAAWELQIYYNGNTTAGLTINLEGSVASGANFVFASSQADPAILDVTDQTSSAGLFNGDDAITVLNGGVVADSIGQIGVDPGSYWGSGDQRTQDRTLRRREGAPADTDPYDSYDPAAYFDGFATNSFDDLGAAGGGTDPDPSPDPVDMTCGAPAATIASIQGNADASPLVDQSVVIEAVVTGKFNDAGGLGGFFVESEPAKRDADPLTSEGLFVFAPEQQVAAGQRVRLAGTVAEFFGLTQLTNVAEMADCGVAELPAPASITLPWETAEAPEAFEAMRVTVAEPLTVNDNYDLGRYGSLTLGSDRHFIPTNIVAPGIDAAQVAAMNDLDRVILDDGSNRQNPAVVPYPSPQLSASQTVRAGDRVHDLTGILSFSFGEWRIQPLQAPSFEASNPRTAAPELSGTGSLVVTSFNVLNFFNGDGFGGGFPTARGADNAEELSRQTAKLVSAILATNADVVGLVEIENDGFDETSAIAELTASLGGNWSYVDPGLSELGSDAIAVGFVYRNDRAVTVGEAATLATAPFNDLNRQPLAQTFRPLDSDDGVTIAVNHFKSKGCGSAEGAEADQGDGQGCWNPTRTQAATALASWLASDPTGTAESDLLIIGDLNAYAKEDPITAITNAGFSDLIAEYEGEQAYSYVFFGQAGYLDHALANEALAAKVVDATVWPINADEPRALDYNTEFKTPQQQAAYYAPDAYRASDHDPVIVALNLVSQPTSPVADLNGDGRVNGRDVSRLLLALLFGRADVETYDLNADGKVNFGDLKVVIRALRKG